MRRHNHSAVQRSGAAPTIQGPVWRLVVADAGCSIVCFPDVLPAADFLVAVYRVVDDRPVNLFVLRLRSQRTGTEVWSLSGHAGVAVAARAGIIFDCGRDF